NKPRLTFKKGRPGKPGRPLFVLREGSVPVPVTAIAVAAVAVTTLAVTVVIAVAVIAIIVTARALRGIDAAISVAIATAVRLVGGADQRARHGSHGPADKRALGTVSGRSDVSTDGSTAQTADGRTLFGLRACGKRHEQTHHHD